MAQSDKILTFLKAQGWSAAEIACRPGGTIVWQVEVSKSPHFILALARSQHQAWLLAAEQAFAVTRDDYAGRRDAANRLLAANKDSGEAVEELDAIEYDLGMLDFAERELTSG